MFLHTGKFKSLGMDDKKDVEQEMLELQQLLNSASSSQQIHSNGLVFSDKELNQILDRTELYDEMKRTELTINNGAAANFASQR